MKSVTYWYQFFTAREELVPILHDVKFTKGEIYGSTQLVAFFIKLDFACPLKVAVFVGFLNNNSFNDVIAVEILTRFKPNNIAILRKMA